MTEPATTTRLPASTIVLALGGGLLVIGAFLDWISSAGIFGVTGVRARYGLVTLAVGLYVQAVAFGAGRLYDVSYRKPVAVVTLLLGAASAGLALAVGFTIVNAADSEPPPAAAAAPADPDDPFAALGESFDQLGDDLAEAFAPKLGVGVFVTVAGGALVAVGAAASLGRRNPLTAESAPA